METFSQEQVRKRKSDHRAPVLLKTDGIVFDLPYEYFEHVSEKTGCPPYFKHFKDATLESEGIKLHLDIYEAGKSAPTLVFIPDMLVYTMCYGEFLYTLGKEGYNIVAMDIRGQGQSGGERGSYTIMELLSDIINVTTYAIKRFNPNVSLAGSGLGGILCFYMAGLDTRVKSVVCHNIADLTAPETKELAKHPKLVNLLSMILKLGNEEKKIPIDLSLSNLEEYEIPYFGTIKKFLQDDPLVLKEISLKTINSILSAAMPAKVEDIRVPVMTIAGTEDHVFPAEYTQWLYDRLTCKKKLEFYKGLDHFMLYKNVTEILPPIVDWLDEIHSRTLSHGNHQSPNKERRDCIARI